MADKTFKLQIISPTRIFFNEDVEMVEMKTSEGEIGVLAGHIPLTAILEPGVLKIRQGTGVKEAALHDGFVEIRKDKVTVLAESCEWPDEIDENRAREAEERAKRRLQAHDPKIDLSRAEIALRKAMVRQELAKMR